MDIDIEDYDEGSEKINYDAPPTRIIIVNAQTVSSISTAPMRALTCVNRLMRRNEFTPISVHMNLTNRSAHDAKFNVGIIIETLKRLLAIASQKKITKEVFVYRVSLDICNALHGRYLDFHAKVEDSEFGASERDSGEEAAIAGRCWTDVLIALREYLQSGVEPVYTPFSFAGNSLTALAQMENLHIHLLSRMICGEPDTNRLLAKCAIAAREAGAQIMQMILKRMEAPKGYFAKPSLL